MKVALYKRNGPAGSVLELADKPEPIPNPGEVQVKLQTSGVNPSDVKSRAGRPLAFEFVVPHSDGAGIIVDVGEGVDRARIGERVWIWNGQWQRQYGTAAEFIAVPEEQAVTLPKQVGFTESACFGIPGLTAAHAVNELENLEAQTVLITGGASAVGHYAVQMSKAIGKTVIATASVQKMDEAVEAGADHVLDYRSEDVAARLSELTGGNGVGAVIDMDFSSTSLLIPQAAVSPNATVICYGSNDMGDLSIPFRDLLFKSITLRFFLVYELDANARAAAVERLTELAASGNLKTRIDSTFSLDDIATAHEKVETGQASGNVVLEL